MASVGDVLSDLELRVLLMKIQEHIRNLQRTGVTGEGGGVTVSEFEGEGE